MKKIQNGFSVAEVVIVLVILGVIGFIGWKIFGGPKQTDSAANSQTQNSEAKPVPDKLIWQQTGDGWRATETAPACPSQPMLASPTDLSKVTSILYPGQTRGGNYKPHGGFRFDNTTDNAITVTAPIDGFIIKGTRYIADGEDEVQYGFDIMNNCGIMYRVGHLRELPANMQKIADTFPAATTSSQNHSVNPAVYVRQGDVLATKVGIISDKNAFFDWGVYDFRQTNEASSSPAYQSAHSQDKELSWHAVCWLKDWLPVDDTAIITKLPAGDPTSGKTSDYCK